MDKLFYKKAADYWSNVPPTLEGVLGGFGFISDIDIAESKYFLDSIFSIEKPPSTNIALDCGAGIGRVTKGVLIEVFDKVDMIDQNKNFLKVAEDTIEPKTKIGTLYPLGLQEFETEKKYDVIWSQWVLGHLTDNDFIVFFTMCRNSLGNNGVIIVKENVTSSGKLEKDDIDSSVTRSLRHLIALFKKSNLTIIKQHKQTNFPRGLYPVYLFALRPSDLHDAKSELSALAKPLTEQIHKSEDKNIPEAPIGIDKLSRDLNELTV